VQLTPGNVTVATGRFKINICALQTSHGKRERNIKMAPQIPEISNMFIKREPYDQKPGLDERMHKIGHLSLLQKSLIAGTQTQDVTLVHEMCGRTPLSVTLFLLLT
jgi:hypothetical protein